MSWSQLKPQKFPTFPSPNANKSNIGGHLLQCLQPLKRHHMGVNPKIMGKPPKSSILIGFFHYKPSIFRYPYFWVDTHISSQKGHQQNCQVFGGQQTHNRCLCINLRGAEALVPTNVASNRPPFC